MSGRRAQDSLLEIVPLILISEVYAGYSHHPLITDGTSPRKILCRNLGHDKVLTLHRSQAIEALLRTRSIVYWPLFSF